jgi:uncharacterized protein
MKKKQQFFLLLFILVIIYPSFSQDKKFEGMFWEVRSKTAVVYLLGSIHVGNEGLYPLHPAIEQAYNESKYLVVEADIKKADPYEIMQKGIYQDSNTLEKNVSPEAFKTFVDMFKKYGLDKSYYNKFKPWLAVIMVMALELKSAGYQQELGIDVSFLNKNDSSDTKETLELESIDDQMKIFDEIANHQDAFLEFSLEDLNKSTNEIDTILSIWKSGDVVQLEERIMKPFRENPKLDPIYQKLFIERNIKMTKKIKEYLTTKDKYFVIVGAGHLIGKKGIIDLLKPNQDYIIKKY